MATVQSTADGVNSWVGGVSEVGHSAAAGVGSLLRTARDGFGSASPSERQTVTHIYHGDRGKNSAVTIVVVGGATSLAAYCALCWWKGWEIFGISHKRTQEMILKVQQSALQGCWPCMHGLYARADDLRDCCQRNLMGLNGLQIVTCSLLHTAVHGNTHNGAQAASTCTNLLLRLVVAVTRTCRSN